MAEDSWMKSEREMFIKNYSPKPPMTDKEVKRSTELLRKYNAHLVKALFGESPFVAQNLKESLIKSKESEVDGE